MTAVFWDRKGVSMGEFMQQDHSNVRNVLKNTKKLHSAIQNQKRGVLISSILVVPLHDFEPEYS
jgi:hypothetical protein